MKTKKQTKKYAMAKYPLGGISAKEAVDVYLQDGDLWASQKQIGRLFDCSRQNIGIHLDAIFREGELEERVVCKEYLHTTQHGAVRGKTQARSVKLYNLDAIISVGYRVNSKQATQFRKWATHVLKEYVEKGFVIDDERLKKGHVNQKHVDDLTERASEIRTSDRILYQKLKDIYATSIDYDPNSQETRNFFAMVQNILLYASTEKTAAEVIRERANASKENMGITCIKGGDITKRDVGIAKNYLEKEELFPMRKLTEMFLASADLIAFEKTPMKQSDWIKELKGCIVLRKRKLLQGKGSISMEKAKQHAEKEYDTFKKDLITSNELPLFAKNSQGLA